MTPRARTGVDMVLLACFEDAWRVGGEAFERRVFHPTELGDRRLERLAGIFAIKEAVAKALDLPSGAWLEIEVVHAESGKPRVQLAETLAAAFLSCDVSLSHAGAYVVAVCAALSTEDSPL